MLIVERLGYETTRGPLDIFSVCNKPIIFLLLLGKVRASIASLSSFEVCWSGDFVSG